MNRYKFRGIATEEVHTHHEMIEEGEFVYGYLIDSSTIRTKMSQESGGIGSGIVQMDVSVDPTTVGQCTGITDIQGMYIYENDIVRKLEFTPEFQTHYGDNIPLGKYTEQIDTNIQWKYQTVQWLDDGLWNIAIDTYTFNEWLEYEKKYDNDQPIRKEILDMFNLPLGGEVDCLNMVNRVLEKELSSFEDIMKAYVMFEIIDQ